MSRYWSPLTRDPVSSAQFRQAFDDVEDLTSVAVGQGVISGLGVASSVGLTLNIASGVAIFAGGYFSYGGGSVSLTNSTTNHIYIVATYVSTSRTYIAEIQANTTGIAPAGSMKLGTVVTSGGAVTVTNFNSSGTRAISLLSLEQLSVMVPQLASVTGDYFPWSATGQLVAAIAQGVSSGAYLTRFEFEEVSGSYLTKTQFALTSGAFGSLSGSFALKSELLAASGSLDSRLSIVENTYVTRTLFNATSGLTVLLQSQTGSYLLKSTSGMFATSGAVAALAAAVSLMFLKTEFAALSGSFYSKAEFASTSGAFFLRSDFASVSGQFVSLQYLRSVSGNLIPWSSSGLFQLAGDYATRTEVNSASGLLLTLAQYAATSGSGGGGGNYFNLNSLTGNVTIGGSGGTSLVQIGQDLYLYSPTGFMSFSDFNNISGSYLLRSEYAATSGSGGGIGAAVLSLNGASGDLTLVASGGTVIQRIGTNINIYSPTGSASSVDLSPYLLQSVYAQSSGTTFIMPMLLGYTPAASGFDNLELPVPYLQSSSGNVPVTFQLNRIVATCTTPGAAMVMTIYKASSGTAMSLANSVGSITLPLNTYQAHSTTGLGTFSSSERLRLFVNTLGTPTNLSVTLEFSPMQTIAFNPTVNATGPMVANLNTPLLANFGWINQSGTVATDTAAGIRIQAVPLATESYRVLILNGVSGTAVSGNWRISGLFINDFLKVNYEQTGLVLRQSSDGKLISLNTTSDSAGDIFNEVRRMGSPTSLTSFVTLPTLNTSSAYIFYRIECVSSVLYFYRSTDGVSWRQLHSEAVGSFLTPNQLGIYVNALNSGTNALMATARHFFFEYI